VIATQPPLEKGLGTEFNHTANDLIMIRQFLNTYKMAKNDNDKAQKDIIIHQINYMKQFLSHGIP
jgi:hemerythrin-like domain-containing protein